MPSDSRLARLEELVAHLEHHVTQQDKIILALSDDVSRLRKSLGSLHDRLAQANPTGIANPPAEDRPPPHYGTGR